MKRFTAVCFWFCEENQRNSAVTQLELRSVFARSAKLNLKQVHRFLFLPRKHLKNLSGHTAVLLSVVARKPKTKLKRVHRYLFGFYQENKKMSGRTAVFCSDRKKPKRAHRCVALSCCQKTKNKVEAGSPLFVWFLPRKQKNERSHRCVLF